MSEFQNKAAIVTGAGRGIGRATALRLAGEGAMVVVNDMDDRECIDTVAAIDAAGGRSVGVPGDVTAAELPARLVAAAQDTFGRLDILVNNAGWVETAPIRDVTEARWQRMLSINLDASFRVLQAVGASFITAHRKERERGPLQHRKIVNVSSVAGVYGVPGSIHYATAKAGTIGMTYGAAREWGRYAINVNAVAFGLIATRLTGRDTEEERAASSELPVTWFDDERYEQARSSSPLRRAGTVDEAAGAIRFLCSGDSNYVTGEVLLCSGGSTSG